MLITFIIFSDAEYKAGYPHFHSMVEVLTEQFTRLIEVALDLKEEGRVWQGGLGKRLNERESICKNLFGFIESDNRCNYIQSPESVHLESAAKTSLICLALAEE